jgi:Cu/Ag efflux pump CusA
MLHHMRDSSALQAGADVMKRIATLMISVITSAILDVLILPITF